jgi:signal peptidase I
MRFKAFNVPSESMAPTLLPGDKLYVRMRAFEDRDPRRWEIVVFQLARDGTRVSPVDLAPDSPRTTFISRVVGLPGDLVELKDGVLQIDGVAVPEARDGSTYESPWLGSTGVSLVTAEGFRFRVTRAPGVPERALAPLRVPEGRFLLLGDFRNNAQDGRFHGTIPRDSLLGSVGMIYFSNPPGAWRLRVERVGLNSNESLAAE